VHASSGLASFTGCAIDLAGAGYSLRATSGGLTAADSTTFDVAAPPTAQITAPADGEGYRLKQNVTTSFDCSEGNPGPGIASCIDSNGASPPSGRLDTSAPGPFAYTVTATSKSGLSATAQIHYSVIASQSITFTSTPPALAACGGGYTVDADGGASGNPVTFSVDPASSRDACSVVGASVLFTGVGLCVIDADQRGSTYYEAAPQAQQAFTIGPAAQAIAFPATSVTYGQADFSPAAAASGLAVTYSNPVGPCAVDPSGLVQITGAGSCAITANQAGNALYRAATPVTQTFTIDRAPLFVDANDATAAFAQGPKLGYSLDGFVNGEDATRAGVSGSADCKAATPSQHPGTYPGAITCAPGTLSAPNYRFIAGASGTLTITQASQSISFPATPVLYTQPDFSPASADSGLLITYSSPSGHCAIDAQGLVQLAGQGSCTITANQAGNGDYGPAAPVTQTLAIIGPPTAAIASPADRQTYTQGQLVSTSFSCSEAAGGPGIRACTDSGGASDGSGTLDTSTTGTHVYTVTASSQDGLTGGATIQYTVVSAHLGAVDHLVWSPSPVAAAGSLGQGGQATATVTAVDAAGQPVQAGPDGMVIFVSLQLATSATGRLPASTATASCGQISITSAGAFCPVPANAIARVQVSYTSSRNQVFGNHDALLAAVDAFGSKQAEDRYSYPTRPYIPGVTAVDHLQFSPDPIAPAGSLRPGATVPVTVTASDPNDGPIPGVPLQLLLGTFTGSSQADSPCGSIPTTGTGRICTTGPDGAIHITYHAPTGPALGGSDRLTATFTLRGTTLHAQDLYTFQ
jgi:hypothetical protein